MEPKRRYDEVRYVVFDVQEKKYISDEWVDAIGSQSQHFEYGDTVVDATLFDSMDTVRMIHRRVPHKEFNVSKVYVRTVVEPMIDVLLPTALAPEPDPVSPEFFGGHVTQA